MKKNIVDIAGEINGVAQLISATAAMNPEIADSLIILTDKLDELIEDILAYAKADKTAKETVGRK